MGKVLKKWDVWRNVREVWVKAEILRKSENCEKKLNVWEKWEILDLFAIELTEVWEIARKFEKRIYLRKSERNVKKLEECKKWDFWIKWKNQETMRSMEKVIYVKKFKNC